jgi:hypothetical protein
MPTRLHRAATGAAVAWLITIPYLALAHQAPPAPPTAQPATLAPSPEAEAYLAAVRKGDVAAVEKLLAAGVAVDTPFRYKRTALSFAADRGDAAMVKLLLDKGANPDVADTFYNQTALAWAAGPAQARKPEHAEVVGLLLAKGAKGRERALGTAIGNNDVRMTQIILDAGGLPPALLSELLASAKKAADRGEIVAALEKAGATMPVVATLTPAQLARLAGTYNDGRTDVTLSIKDGALVAAFGGQSATLSPRSDTAFTVEGQPGVGVAFSLEGERVTALTVMNQTGVPAVYKRVSP